MSSIGVVRLKYANATKLVGILNSLQASARAQGKVVNVALAADPENNTVLVNGNLSGQMMMRSLIRRLDTPGANGSGNTVVIHLKYLDAKTIAPILTKIATGTIAAESKAKGDEQTASSAGISIQPEETDNALIIHAPKAMIQNLRLVINKLDQPPEQVLVQAIIVKVNQNVLNQLGIIWSTQTTSYR